MPQRAEIPGQDSAPDHWPFLDLVRFGAALLVLFGHARSFVFVSIRDVPEPGLLTRAFYLVTGLHYEAVMLFFVVSGFLIGGGVWTGKARGGFDLSRYLLNRFVRIYLVLLPALVLTFLVTVLGRTFLSDTRLFGLRPLPPGTAIHDGWSLGQIPCHLLSLPGVACAPWGANPPLWSLGYEWAYYLAAPALFAAIFGRGERLGSVTLFLAAAIIAALGALDPISLALFFAFWLMGAAASRLAAAGGVPLFVGLAGLGVCAAGLVLSRLSVLPVPLTSTLVAAGLALAVACRAITGARIFDNAAVRRGAGFSFSLYLTHLPVALLAGALIQRLGGAGELQQPGTPAYITWTALVAAALLAADLFARLTEDRTAQVRRALASAFSARAPQPSIERTP
ncbi:MAG TPA: acyltransferase [Beijerinckiaceae bacterium]|jgi:peptidoglycan/LPS O-acetylase OafA/YrhL